MTAYTPKAQTEPLSSEGVSAEPATMTREEHQLEDLKQQANYVGPIVSFDVREPYYLASCDRCGRVGSSELCGTDSWGDDSDVYCPRCSSAGADCGKIAERLGAALSRQSPSEGRVYTSNPVETETGDQFTREGREALLREALEWYGEQARLARLIHSEGDAGRNALAADGGKRASQVLKQAGGDQ